MSLTVVILAAGSGTRMQTDKTKQQLLLNGKSVLFRAVSSFEYCNCVDDIIVAVRDDEMYFAEDELSSFKKVRKIVAGGRTRLESAKIAFDSIDWSFDYIAIHDGARCFVNSEIINAVFRDAELYGAATASSIITDTVKQTDGNGNIKKTVDRKSLVCVQTPQIFKSELYARGINAVDLYDADLTDDNMLIERLGVPVHCTATGRLNIKITVPEDLILAECLLNGEIEDV